MGLARPWRLDAAPRAIAVVLDRETAKRDAIERLEELRTVLISAAVTGRIDVRESVGG